MPFETKTCWCVGMERYSLGRTGRRDTLYINDQLECMEVCLGVDAEPTESFQIRIKGNAGTSSARPSARPWTWVGAISSTNIAWVMSGLMAALWRRTWEGWWMKNWRWASKQCVLAARKASPILGGIKSSVVSRSRRDSHPLFHSHETCPGLLYPSLRATA